CARYLGGSWNVDYW
nr:immunoglobulin heavy chain junction region [Macaca mulatta]MOX91507.1 immunoglobulin heavy chain junction region [Macaca mulatta]MOX91583.1 immunoglobulin heavy chain junction region [Macaca mulatta]MOX92039.1 immunoglobulin heavy chain junction region [Macaca mulatta]MOX92312.1 immunoglobulin heavy chain junction region [Macaca mulatta]